jgi:hypothetical protein
MQILSRTEGRIRWAGHVAYVGKMTKCTQKFSPKTLLKEHTCETYIVVFLVITLCTPIVGTNFSEEPAASIFKLPSVSHCLNPRPCVTFNNVIVTLL